MINLIETSIMEEDDDKEFFLDGYQEKIIKIGTGKGIATYYSPDKFKQDGEVRTDKFQILRFKHEGLDIISVYRSKSGSSTDLLDNLKKLIEPGRATIIAGDFNICYMENFSNRMVQGLLSLGFDQLVHEATHIHGRHIDHLYFLDPSKRLMPIIDRYSPYYSDHDGICITIPELMLEKEE